MSEQQYLVTTLGITLQQCLSEVCKLQPSDPIETLACLLLKNEENKEVSKKIAYQKKIEEEILIEEQQTLVLLNKMREEESDLSKSQFDHQNKEKIHGDRRRSSAYQPSLRVVEESRLEN